MVKQGRSAVKKLPPRQYQSPNVPFSAIRRYARQVAERFKPEKIILFGSYAYGTPHEDSDVDLMVIMPAWNEISQSVRISRALDAPFSLDLFVRTPEKLRRRLAEGDWFFREVVEKGKVLYAKGDCSLGAQSRRRPSRRAGLAKCRTDAS
jgi:predicted nucleotidyltransferase